MPAAARISAVSIAMLGLISGLASTASADPGERIVSYDVAVVIAANGRAHVTETIAYDFGANQRHGITRKLTRRPLAGTATASSPDGAPATVTTSGNTIRVGDPATTVTGVHGYVLDYDINSAMVLTGSTAAVTWEMVDGSWDVPVSAMTGTITAPAPAALERCVLAGATACGGAVADGNVIRVQHKDLSPHAVVRVAASVPSAGLTLTTPRRTYSTPTYTSTATRETESSSSSSSSSSGSAAFGWVFGLGVVGLFIALISAASRSGKGRRPRSGRGYHSGDTYYSSGGYYSSGDSGSSSSSSSSDSSGGSSSSSDSGSSSSSGSW